MNTEKKQKYSFKEVIKNIGAKSIIASVFVFLLTVTATGIGGYELYRATKENLHLRSMLNAVESAKAFDGYLLVRKNTVLLAGYVVEEMMRTGKSTEEILEYLTAESVSIQEAIDKDYTGLYGWINGEYCDGVGWVPDEDYVPTERPWYTETMADDSEITFVKPYLDEQTMTVLTTMARELSDGESVIALDVTLSQIQDITFDIAQETPGSYGIVLDKDGQVIAHSDINELGKNYLEETGTLGAALAEQLYNGDSNQFELVYDGQKYMAFAETIEGDWKSISLVDTKVYYRPLKIILFLLILFTLLEAAVFIIVLYSQSAKNLAIASAKEAQSANRAKSLFLSQMSHEIRTPINAIIGLDSIALRDESISPQTRDGLEKIGSSAKHLLSIINDILDMSRIESGRMDLKEELFSLYEIIEQVRIIIGGQCDDKGLTFVCDKDEQVDDYFVGDGLKIKQMIINILGNSVKFTNPPGEVRFTVGQTDCADGRAALHFKMEDTGIGMDKEYLPRLFESFSMEDSGNTSKYGGSGLGMAITKSFVDMMGGEIRVESEKGVGTTFDIFITLRQATEAELSKTGSEEETAANVSLEGLHLLIVEDQEMNAEVLTDLLELEDISSEWAQNGQLGIETFNRYEEGHFAAILMDMRMPVMDGITATMEIRKLDRPDAKTIPIIALTANAFEEDVKQCLQAGMNAHLSKPVDIGLLKETLGRLLN